VIGLYTNTGAYAAAYEYDAFGRQQTAAGSYAGNNPYRTATKYTDTETTLVYYGHRYYHPVLGRFINRDPIEEAGGINLYAFCANDGINGYDFLGMSEKEDKITLDPFVVKGSNGDPQEAIADYEQGRLLNDLRSGLTYAADYSSEVGTALKGFFWEGPKGTVIGLLQISGPVSQIKNVHMQWRFILRHPGGIRAGAEALRQLQIAVLRKEWSRLTNTTQGNGELVFHVTLLAVTVGDAVAVQVEKSLAALDGVSVNALGAESWSLAAESGSEASSVMNAILLTRQLTAEEIANGHAFDKHVVTQAEFPEINTKQQFGEHVENILNNPTEMKTLSNGRTAYWDDATQTVIIRNPAATDGGTAFRPTVGKAYFDGLK
jgi:filamentous hemagglutinin